MLYFSFYLLTACGTNQKLDSGSNASNEPSTEDTGPPWTPGGQGVAYFLDGATNNSLFTLELSNATSPPEGESYTAYLLGGSSELNIGELTIESTEVLWQAEIEINGLMGGINRFEARLNDGTVIYAGSVDPQIEQAYRQLLIASPLTPEGEGSLRALQNAIEEYILHAQSTIDEPITTDYEIIHEKAEQLYNSIYGATLDRDNDGEVSVLPNILPITNELNGMSSAETFLVELVLDDLALGSAAVDPGHPIKDLANLAYDCTQLVEKPSRDAAEQADVAVACISEEFCDSKMLRAKELLMEGLSGYDVDEDGSITLETEGSIQCAIFYVNQMAFMDISVYSEE